MRRSSRLIPAGIATTAGFSRPAVCISFWALRQASLAFPRQVTGHKRGTRSKGLCDVAHQNSVCRGLLNIIRPRATPRRQTEHEFPATHGIGNATWRFGPVEPLGHHTGSQVGVPCKFPFVTHRRLRSTFRKPLGQIRHQALGLNPFGKRSHADALLLCLPRAESPSAIPAHSDRTVRRPCSTTLLPLSSSCAR